MNNNDLAEKIADAAGLTKADASKVVDGVLAAIVDAVAAGDEVSLNGLASSRSRTAPPVKAATPPRAP